MKPSRFGKPVIPEAVIESRAEHLGRMMSMVSEARRDETRFRGTIRESKVIDETYWLVEIPLFGGPVTQGTSPDDAMRMVEDWLKLHCDPDGTRGYRATATLVGDGEFEVEANMGCCEKGLDKRDGS